MRMISSQSMCKILPSRAIATTTKKIITPHHNVHRAHIVFTFFIFVAVVCSHFRSHRTSDLTSAYLHPFIYQNENKWSIQKSSYLWNKSEFFNSKHKVDCPKRDALWNINQYASKTEIIIEASQSLSWVKTKESE